MSHVMSTKPAPSTKYKQGSARLKHSAEGTECVYNEKTLDYAHFVHCVSVLERLLLYREGREMFPVTLRDGKSQSLFIDKVQCMCSDHC